MEALQFAQRVDEKTMVTHPRAISVGGAKGGTGKSCIVANMGIALSLKGKKVVLVDTDIEAPNLHTFVGVNYPRMILDDYITGSVSSVKDIVLSTPIPNLFLISSAQSRYALTGISYQQRQRFFNAVKKLDADVLIFDIAAGSRMRVIDYFSIAPLTVILLEPLPTALENAYGFLKNLLYRHLLRLFYHDRGTHARIVEVLGDKENQNEQSLDKLLIELDSIAHDKVETFKALFISLQNMYLILNKVRNANQQEVTQRFARVVKRYLMFNVRIGGWLPYEPGMDQSIVRRTPFIIDNPQSNFADGMSRLLNILF